MLVFQCDFCTFMKWHLKITVKTAIGNDSYGHGINNTFSGKTAAEKVSQRGFHRGCFFTVPIHPKHKITEYKTVGITCFVINSNPDMSYHTGAFNISQSSCFPRGNIPQAGTSFSGGSQRAGGHTALSLFSGWVFCIDTS